MDGNGNGNEQNELPEEEIVGYTDEIPIIASKKEQKALQEKARQSREKHIARYKRNDCYCLDPEVKFQIMEAIVSQCQHAADSKELMRPPDLPIVNWHGIGEFGGLGAEEFFDKMKAGEIPEKRPYIEFQKSLSRTSSSHKKWAEHRYSVCAWVLYDIIDEIPECRDWAQDQAEYYQLLPKPDWIWKKPGVK